MTQILAASPTCQMRLTKPSSIASSKLWNSVVLKQKKQSSSSKVRSFKVMALQSDNSTINRVESLLNLDTKPFTDRIIAEYIWIGGSGIDLRSKSRTLEKPVEDPSELPKWNYDGSSTGQAPGEDSEVILYPQAIFRDPFRGGNNILVICDTYTPAGEPIPTNKRARAAEIFSNKKVHEEIPWFGIEQEYTLLQPNVNWPLGWPVGAYPGPQGPYYCGVGAEKSWGRDISDAHYKACLYAGINISGTNGEVMPGQWEFQVGPSVGIEAGDHVWCARYLLERITEQAGVVLTLDPKPIEGDWNGAGCHTNYSTKSMREDGGFEVIKKAILNLSLRHMEHISAYGEGNERRLTGKHETASIDQFSWGVANRGCSIRVGRDTEKKGKGYLEDRRPASNMDPYIVTSLLAETTLLWEPTLEAEALAAQKLSLKEKREGEKIGGVEDMPEGTELELPEDAVFTEAAEQDGANQLGDVVLEEAGFDVEDDQVMETEIQEVANVTEGKERHAIKKKLGKASGAAMGGTLKKRLVQSVVSPRKKHTAKQGSKMGEKGILPPRKASVKPDPDQD
ncbi:hypothetical protein Bca101_038392 [Brassica carinata]